MVRSQRRVTVQVKTQVQSGVRLLKFRAPRLLNCDAVLSVSKISCGLGTKIRSVIAPSTLRVQSLQRGSTKSIHSTFETMTSIKKETNVTREGTKNTSSMAQIIDLDSEGINVEATATRKVVARPGPLTGTELNFRGWLIDEIDPRVG